MVDVVPSIGSSIWRKFWNENTKYGWCEGQWRCKRGKKVRWYSENAVKEGFIHEGTAWVQLPSWYSACKTPHCILPLFKTPRHGKGFRDQNAGPDAGWLVAASKILPVEAHFSTNDNWGSIIYYYCRGLWYVNEEWYILSILPLTDPLGLSGFAEVFITMLASQYTCNICSWWSSSSVRLLFPNL